MARTHRYEAYNLLAIGLFRMTATLFSNYYILMSLQLVHGSSRPQLWLTVISSNFTMNLCHVWQLLILSTAIFNTCYAANSRRSSRDTPGSKTVSSSATGSQTTSSSASATPSEDDSTIEVPKGTWISPKYEYFFQFPLPIGPKKTPK
jgi:hypothetical protein